LSDYQTLILAPVISLLFLGELLFILGIDYLMKLGGYTFQLRSPFIFKEERASAAVAVTSANITQFQRFDHGDSMAADNKFSLPTIQLTASTSPFPFYTRYIRTAI